MQIILSFLLPVEAGLFPPCSHPFQINEEKGNRTQHPPPLPPVKAYELVENEQTNEQNTTVNSSRKEPTDTQNSKNTVLFFFCLFPFLSFFITVIPLNGQYHRRGLSPGVLVWRQWSGPPPGGSVELGGNSPNRLVSSAVIYYLSISQCGRKKRRMRRGEG